LILVDQHHRNATAVLDEACHCPKGFRMYFKMFSKSYRTRLIAKLFHNASPQTAKLHCPIDEVDVCTVSIWIHPFHADHIKSNANLYSAIYRKRIRGAGTGTRPDRLR